MNNNEKITNGLEFGKKIFNQMSRSILPIIAKTGKDKMEGVGSCTLININQINFIVTAAHVSRTWGKNQLYISTKTKLIEIKWPFVMTKEGNENCDYTLDLAFFPIIPELNDLLFDTQLSLSIDDCDINTIDHDEEVLFAFGYPTSKIKYDKHKKEFKFRPFQYFGKEITDPNLYEKSCSSINDHLLINFVKRKTKTPYTKGFIIAPDTQGISGGGLFRVLLKDNHVEKFILEGILTEWHKSLSLMKCSRSKEVKKSIMSGKLKNIEKSGILHITPKVLYSLYCQNFDRSYPVTTKSRV